MILQCDNLPATGFSDNQQKHSEKSMYILCMQFCSVIRQGKVYTGYWLYHASNTL